jgi:hypothetical protein
MSAAARIEEEEPRDKHASFRHITLVDAAGKLGLPANETGRVRLFRVLAKREKELGLQIMIRRGGALRPRYYITMPILEEFCPEFFDRRDAVAEALGDNFDRIEESLSELVARTSSVEEKLAVLALAKARPANSNR